MQSRYVYADVLRVIAVISVVVLHSVAPVMLPEDSINHGWWWIGNVIDSCCTWGVPIFIMLSGMLLLDTSKNEPAGLFFKKRFNKVIIPLFVWSLAYSFGKTAKLLVNGEGFAFSIPDFMRDLLTGNIYFHLFFLYPLIGLYIVTPILRTYVRNASDRNLAYFLILWFIANPIYSLLSQFCDIRVAIPLSLVTGYTGYFILGYYLNKVHLEDKYRRLVYLLAACSVLASIAGTYFFSSAKTGDDRFFFYSYLGANSIVISTAIFLACKKTDWSKIFARKPLASRLITNFSNASFGIYLIHPMILALLDALKINALFIHPALGLPLTSILTIIASFALTRLLQAIPLVRRIVP